MNLMKQKYNDVIILQANYTKEIDKQKTQMNSFQDKLNIVNSAHES